MGSEKSLLHHRASSFRLRSSFFNSYAPDASAVVKSKSRKEYIFERFYESLVQSYQSERSVKFYADQLCLTPKHLSGIWGSQRGSGWGVH